MQTPSHDPLTSASLVRRPMAKQYSGLHREVLTYHEHTSCACGVVGNHHLRRVECAGWSKLSVASDGCRTRGLPKQPSVSAGVRMSGGCGQLTAERVLAREDGAHLTNGTVAERRLRRVVTPIPKNHVGSSPTSSTFAVAQLTEAGVLKTPTVLV